MLPNVLIVVGNITKNFSFFWGGVIYLGMYNVHVANIQELLYCSNKMNEWSNSFLPLGIFFSRQFRVLWEDI